MRRSRRTKFDVGRVVRYAEIERHILYCFSALLFGKAVEADRSQIGSGKGYIRRI
jgi:hypothetical protein